MLQHLECKSCGHAGQHLPIFENGQQCWRKKNACSLSRNRVQKQPGPHASRLITEKHGLKSVSSSRFKWLGISYNGYSQGDNGFQDTRFTSWLFAERSKQSDARSMLEKVRIAHFGLSWAHLRAPWSPNSGKIKDYQNQPERMDLESSSQPIVSCIYRSL